MEPRIVKPCAKAIPLSIFANGVDQETEPDAPFRQTGAPGYAVFACLGWKEWRTSLIPPDHSISKNALSPQYGHEMGFSYSAESC
jgi:hypothetical protein